MLLKSEILKELEENKDTDISGQLLAGKLGVSRNAIWKAINSLKDEGYKILSGPNKGYRLAEGNDLISAEGIGTCLSEKYKDINIVALKEIDSTNNEAKRLIAKGSDKTTLIIAECQTAGRGRLGRSFYSPSQTGIYMTLIINTDEDISDAVSITSAAAVSVVCAIQSLTDKKPKIKWVNDIYLEDKKICGILTEAVSDFETGSVQSIIVGIGININTSIFPDEITEVATSLGSLGITRNRLVAEITNNLLGFAENLSDKSYLDVYRKHSMVLGKEINYYKNKEKFSGTAIAIDDKGGLVIRNDNGTESILNSGEITIRIKKV